MIEAVDACEIGVNEWCLGQARRKQRMRRVVTVTIEPQRT